MSRLYTETEAIVFGLRHVCRVEGHRLESLMDRGISGGILGRNAACDEIRCKRCDVTFSATYPPIGQEAKP